MKILTLVTDAFGGHGGIAKFNRDLLTAIASFDKVSHVIAIPRLASGTIGNEIPEKIDYRTEALNSKFLFAKALINTVFANKDISLIICGHINLLPFAFFARWILKCPVVLIGHGIDIWQPTKRTYTNWLAKHVDAFIAVSDFTRKKFLNWSALKNSKTYILPNCFEPGDFSPGEKNKSMVEKFGLANRKVLLTFGRLAGRERAKGFDEVIETLPILISEDPSIIYVIAGAGPDQMRLEEKASSLGVRPHVVFTGYVEEVDKPDIYRLADVYVMPSGGEGFGIVFLEAMACGIPVIASKIDGSQEAVLNGELGMLVTPTDKNELKQAILQSLLVSKEVPKRLSYFSYQNYTLRVHQILNALSA
ncbi:MAG: glycosyltransferase family 4 protein [Gammaproteobacteria bacterium]|nr:glycosyltransferase family 4 protein [Gammaproteobacteria bacterium]